jgi:hypothetical protein
MVHRQLSLDSRYYRIAAKTQLALGSAGLLSSLFLVANGDMKGAAILPSILMMSVGVYGLANQPQPNSPSADEA